MPSFEGPLIVTFCIAVTQLQSIQITHTHTHTHTHTQTLIICKIIIQSGSNMTETDLCVNKPQSVPVIFEPRCIYYDGPCVI
jgi:hypothetical protein